MGDRASGGRGVRSLNWNAVSTVSPVAVCARVMARRRPASTFAVTIDEPDPGDNVPLATT